MQAISRAHANIALIKYWGKADEHLHIPFNSNLSFTQSALYTETKIDFNEDYKQDQFYLNNKKQSLEETKKISDFVDIYRQGHTDYKFKVESFNSMPTAAGFGSSSSAFAALATAVDKALDLNLSKKELSAYARKGSGSASRSIFGGFSLWHAGNSDESSYAEAIDPGDWDISTITLFTSAAKKPLSSRKGMQLSVETSPYYKLWPELAEQQLKDIIVAIKQKDIAKIGSISESNALAMHSLTITSEPAVFYFNSQTLKHVAFVYALRKQGIPVYFTLDAGPNLVLICPKTQAQDIAKRFKAEFPDINTIISTAGPAAQIVEKFSHA